MKKITLFLFALLFTTSIYSQTALPLSLFLDIDVTGDTIYVSTMSMGVIRSTDSGDTWLSAYTGIEGMDIMRLSISPQNPQNLVATVWNPAGIGYFVGIYKSIDGGSTWNISSNGLTGSNNLVYIEYDPSNSDLIYCGGYSELYKSTDGGDNWTILSGFNGDVSSLLVQSDGAILCGGWSGLKKSNDGGISWLELSGFPAGENILGIKSISSDFNTIYITLGDAGGSIYKTTDGGISWNQVAQNIGGGNILSLVGTSTIYVGNKRGCYKSDDGGTDWSVVDTTSLLLGYQGSLANNNLYIVSGGGIFVVEGVTTSIGESMNFFPLKFSLSQNYPNPFNPLTTIEFSLNSPEKVTINIYDINGQLTRNLFNEELVAGTYTARWEGTDNFGKRVASGTYFYRIDSGNSFDVKKMILLK